MDNPKDIGTAAILGLGVGMVIYHLSLLPSADANLFAGLGSAFVFAVMVLAQ